MESRFKFSSIYLDLFSCQTLMPFGRRRAFPTASATCSARTSLPLFKTESHSSTIQFSRRKAQLHDCFGSFWCLCLWGTWPAAFWRARSFLLFPFLEVLAFGGWGGDDPSWPLTSSLCSSPLFLFFLITSSPWENPRGGARGEVPNGSGADVPSTDAMLIDHFCIGIFSVGLGSGLKRDGNQITG